MWRTIGHEWATQMLQRALATQRLAHAYLLTGPAQVGKATLAREFAAALNCTGAQAPCGLCRACTRVAQGAHPDVLTVEAVEGTVKIDQVRAAQHELSLTPFEGRFRVCLLPDFHQATPEAANALLKTLEEPSPHVVLLLTTTDASLLLPTVVSRCQVLALRGVPEAVIADALRVRWQVKDGEARVLARLAAGRIGWAICAAQQPAVLTQRALDLDALDRVLAQGRVARLAVAESVSARDDRVDVLHLWQTWWRDVMFVSSGCPHLVVNLDRSEGLRQQAEQCRADQAAAACASINMALEQIEQNVTPRLSLEAMLLSWPQLHELAVAS